MADIATLKNNAVRSATYDTVLQVGLRILSFLLNAFIIRHVSQAVFAIMSVKLYLLYATGLFLSQEAFQRAALSSNIRKDNSLQLINMIWLGTGLSVPLALIEWFIWCYVAEEPPEDIALNYNIAVALMALSVVVKVTAEVPYILAELNYWAKIKVCIEATMQLLRSSLLAIGVILWPTSAVLVYAVTHLIGSCVYTSIYYFIFAQKLKYGDKKDKLIVTNFRQLFPRFGDGQKCTFNTETLTVAWSFFKQGWLKWILTEGEYYLMNFFPLITLSQQGVYQVVNNLGSLAARLVFRSMEAASYKFFAQILQRGIPLRHQDASKGKEAAKAFNVLLRNLVLGSLIITSFGWSYSHSLLWLYGGSSLSESGTQLMRFQCFYVVFLAINGITEAFTFAVMDDKQLSSYNRLLVVFSALYVAATFALTKGFGPAGFVFGNCFNMILRISYSFGFIQEFFRGTSFNPLSSLFVPNKVVLVMVITFMATAMSEVCIYPQSMSLHVIAGGATLVILIYVLRSELRLPIEKILLLFDSGVFARGGRDRRKGHFAKSSFINFIHKFLFGSHEKMA